MAIGRFYFSGEELCRFGDSGDPGVEDAHWCLWEEVEPALATKDAEIARLKAQRDALANDIHREYNMRHARETLSPTPELSANYADWMLKEAHSLRIVGGQVEEVK